MKKLAILWLSLAFITALAVPSFAGNLVTEGLDDPVLEMELEAPKGSSLFAPFKLRQVGDPHPFTGQYYYPDNVSDPDPRTPPADGTPPSDDPEGEGPDEPEGEGPRTGCNGTGCAPDSGGGNSEGNEQSENDND